MSGREGCILVKTSVVQPVTAIAEIATVAVADVVINNKSVAALRGALSNVERKDYLRSLEVEGWRSEWKSVQNLLNHLARKTKSEASKRNYLQIIHRFCKHYNYTPDSLIKLKKKKIEKLIQDYCDTLLNRNCSKRYINVVLHILKTFFKVNGFIGVRSLNLESYHVPTRYRKRKEYVPTKYEIYEMADNAGSLKNRAIILTLFSSGLRVSTLIALTYGDIREELERGFRIMKIPVYADMKKRVPEACKGNIEYFTFASEEATKAIRLYLAERMRKYGNIDENEPLFASDYRGVKKKERARKFMTRREVEYIVKEAARKANIKDWQYVTPHCLRKAFESVLRGELVGGGRLDYKDQEYLMGHILPNSSDAYYDRTKIEKLRLEYAKLSFGRKVIENRFKVLELALSKAFQDTGLDWRKVLRDYVKATMMTE